MEVFRGGNVVRFKRKSDKEPKLAFYQYPLNTSHMLWDTRCQYVVGPEDFICLATKEEKELMDKMLDEHFASILAPIKKSRQIPKVDVTTIEIPKKEEEIVPSEENQEEEVVVMAETRELSDFDILTISEEELEKLC